MRAVESIPGSEEKPQGLSNEQSNLPGNSQDRIYAILRRMSVRITLLETQASTLRRDVARIDKKQYRDEAKLPAAQIEAPAAEPDPRQFQFPWAKLPDPFTGRQ